MGHTVEIHQLRANSGPAFLNVNCCHENEGIGVSGDTYGLTTILCTQKTMFRLMQFGSHKQAEEWIKTQLEKWDNIQFLGGD